MIRSPEFPGSPPLGRGGRWAACKHVTCSSALSLCGSSVTSGLRRVFRVLQAMWSVVFSLLVCDSFVILFSMSSF